jgi:hypothetical protein
MAGMEGGVGGGPLGWRPFWLGMLTFMAVGWLH